MELNIGEPKTLLQLSINTLNKLLADEFVLLAKSWNFHWNVVGPSFGSDHKFMEDIYNEAIDNIDDVAERIRSLGGRPLGSLKEYMKNTRIVEYDYNEPLPNSLGMYKILLDDYETIIREIRNDLKELEAQEVMDEGTMSYLQDLIYRSGKTCWMIRAHLA
ncbi:MAG: Dps family protein [Bacteroidales bacterium]